MSDTPETESSSKAVDRDVVSVQALREVHTGDTAWIVGKGPSLLMLTKEQLGPGPIIAINEAIIAVEALDLDNVIYSLQKDAASYQYEPVPVVLAAGVEPIAPLKGATLLVHLHESADRLSEYRPRFVFDNVADFGFAWWDFSSLVAVAIANLMGCPKVVFVSHDACVTGDARTCTAKSDGSFYVETDTYSAGNYPQHRQRIEAYASSIAVDVEWLTPAPEYRRHKQVTEALEREVGRLSADLQESRAAATAMAAAHTAAHDALVSTRRDLQAVTDRLASTEAHVDALLTSASWRWTAPLRAVYDLINNSRHRSPEKRT